MQSPRSQLQRQILKKARVHFKSHVLAAVAAVNASKLPIQSNQQQEAPEVLVVIVVGL